VGELSGGIPPRDLCLDFDDLVCPFGEARAFPRPTSRVLQEMQPLLPSASLNRRWAGAARDNFKASREHGAGGVVGSEAAQGETDRILKALMGDCLASVGAFVPLHKPGRPVGSRAKRHAKSRGVLLSPIPEKRATEASRICSGDVATQVRARGDCSPTRTS